MSQNKKKGIPKLKYDKSDAKHVFTDVVQLHVSNESVTMDLGIRETPENGNVKISHSVVMTLPHFIRFTDVCLSMANDLKEHFKKELDLENDDD